jgi:class 3 adenylate cyclase/tetratricopeptide (TPR) repeat protein
MTPAPTWSLTPSLPAGSSGKATVNCPSCDQPATTDARFCPSCGEQLVPPSSHQESRRVVTVLFCDLVGSTVLSERLDPEALRELLMSYYLATKAALQNRDGIVEKFIGDAVMGVFGLHDLHEDDALQAVRAAVEMQQAVEQLDRQLRVTLEVELAVRIGIDTGEVVTFPNGRDALVSGEVVTTAARLQQTASPGQILIGSMTRALVRGAVVMEAVPPLELKGKSQLVTAWAVRSVQPGATGIPRHMTEPLVGRDAQMRYLHSNLDHVRDERRGHLLTVFGEPGIGKSRLVSEFLESLRPSYRVLAGRCRPFSRSGGADPLTEIVCQLDQAEPAISDVQHNALREIIDDSVELSISERALAVRTVLESAAGSGALVVAFDDIQWANPSLLDLIEHLTDRILSYPIMLLCATRLDLLDHRPEWSGGKLSCSSMLLPPLSPSHSQELARNLGDFTLHDAGIDFAVDIAERSSGNPLFIEQMSAAVREGSAISTMPVTIRALIASRLGLIEPTEISVLQAAAVIGQEFRVELLRALVPPVEFETVFHRLSRRQLIEEDPAGYRFCSVQIREVVHDATPKRMRAEIHERIGDWLLRRDAEEAAEETAIHLEKALDYYRELGQADHVAVLRPKVATLLSRATRHHFARGDLNYVVDLLDRALAVCEESDPLCCELLTSLGDVLTATGQAGRARATFGTLLATAIQWGNDSAKAHALLGLSRLRKAEMPADVLALATGSVPVFTAAQDDLGLAKAWQRAGQAHQAEGQYERAVAAFNRSLVSATRAASDLEQASTLGGLALSTLRGPMPAADAIKQCEALLADLPRSKRLALVAVTCPLAILLASRRHFTHADGLLREAEGLAGELGHEYARSMMPIFFATVRSMAGEPRAAARRLEDACETLRQLVDTVTYAAMAGDLARLYLELGETGSAVQIMHPDTPWTGEDELPAGWQGAHARVLAAIGRNEAAKSFLDAALTAAFRTDSPETQAVALMDQAHLLADLGNAEKARRSAAMAAARYRGKGHLVGIRQTEAFLAEAAREQPGR